MQYEHHQRYPMKPLKQIKLLNVHGFTLIEMMSVIAIVSIGLLSASSSLQSFIKRSLSQLQLHATTRQFIQDAHFARWEAIQRKNVVSLMPACGNNWDSGWMVVENAEFIASLNIPDELLDRVLLKRHPLASETTHLEWGLKKGNQFEDMSLPNQQEECLSSMSHFIDSFSGERSSKTKHLSFNPAGAAQMKHGGMVANRLVFRSRDFPDMEQHILMGAGGRLRICLVKQGKDCY